MQDIISLDLLTFNYLEKYGQLRAQDYVATGENEWDGSMLHPSQLGTCHRETCLGKIGAARQVREASWYRNRKRKFELANHVHNLVYAALKDVGLLYESELDLEPFMWNGWTGRLDWIDHRYGMDTLHVGDVKSSHPNAMRYATSYPKHHNVLQLGCYYECVKSMLNEHAHFNPDLKLIRSAEIQYMDRGGGNDPLACEIEMTDDLMAEVVAEKVLLEEHVDMAINENILPEPMKRDMKFKSYKKKVVLDTHWQCNPEYCDFVGASCTPITGETTLAELNAENGDYEIKPNGRRYAEEVEEFLAAELDRVTG